jgi:hypothetical protein
VLPSSTFISEQKEPQTPKTNAFGRKPDSLRPTRHRPSIPCIPIISSLDFYSDFFPSLRFARTTGEGDGQLELVAGPG